jgi:serine/threonine-protein kinase HipA
MREVVVKRNGEVVGFLKEESRTSYIFTYDDAWFANPAKPPVSLTLPKTRQVFKSEYLFPFFFNMLSEGVNKKLQSIQLKIDEDDSFGLLTATAQFDTIGAITIHQVESE